MPCFNKVRACIQSKRILIPGLLLFLLPMNAFAAGDVGTITVALNALVDILTGTTAKLIATIAIAGVGYFWLMGKLSLKHAGMVALGIGVIFGAPQIANLLGAGV